MERERAVQLVLRQIKDIQAQADKVLSGDKSEEAIRSFIRYSDDLKAYIAKNITDDKVRTRAEEIPDIDFSGSSVQLWMLLILPAWWYTLYHDYIGKKKVLEEIAAVRGMYAHLELFVRGLLA
jgi:hypothetical protein